MKYLLHFSHECTLYPESHNVVLDTHEKWFGEDNYYRLNRYLKDNESPTITLLLLNDRHDVIDRLIFEKLWTADGNLTVFSNKTFKDCVERDTRIHLYVNPNDTLKTPPFIRMISDNYIDNLCIICKGKHAYVEIN